MGFESFGVTLGGGRNARAAVQEILNLEGAAPDPEAELTPGVSRCFLVRDGNHAIELEVMGDPATISCRFTLCHPPTVDAVFLAVVKKLMQTLGMQVRTCENLGPGLVDEFTLASFDDFASMIADCIASRRTEWKRTFGAQILGATTAQVHERILTPHYQSNVEKAG